MINEAIFYLAIDQGTTSSRALIFDERAQVVGRGQKEFPQYFPKPGWVEHDPEEIWDSVRYSIEKALAQAQLQAGHVAGVGLTNQRETALIWNKKTGKPIYNAIVWQSRQTEALCQALGSKENEKKVREKTGLLIDPYFSGTKFRWILDQRPGENVAGLCAGTIDSWLIWKLTGGTSHVTDVTNAARTMLFNIHSLNWDEELCDLVGVPKSILPAVRDCSALFGKTDARLFGGRAFPLAGWPGTNTPPYLVKAALRPGGKKHLWHRVFPLGKHRGKAGDFKKGTGHHPGLVD